MLIAKFTIGYLLLSWLLTKAGALTGDPTLPQTLALLSQSVAPYIALLLGLYFLLRAL